MSIDNARVLVVGDVAAGKSSLLQLLGRWKPVDDPPSPTVGCELEVVLHKYQPSKEKDENFSSGSPWNLKHMERVRREAKEYFIELLEIGASHAHAVARRMFYHDYSGVILVYDLTSARSCQRLAYWLQELRTYSFERQDGPGDGSFASHNLIPEIVTIGEERKYNLSRRLPVLVVGTKADQTCAIRPEHRGWVDKVLNDNGGGEIKLSTKRITDLAPGTKNLEILHSFFSKVIETRYFPSAAIPLTPVSPNARTRSRSFTSRNKTVAM